VPHPFRFFLRKGWETNETQVYTISENVPKRARLISAAGGRAGLLNLFSYILALPSLASSWPDERDQRPYPQWTGLMRTIAAEGYFEAS
jgi:hypothetical protein